MIKVALDAMGGDKAPVPNIKGALKALKEKDVFVYLIGLEDKLKKHIPSGTSNLEIINASEVIGMDDVPVTALRNKKNSSISVGLNMVRDGKADAFVSAGNTGAVLAGSVFYLGVLSPGVRPGIGQFLPVFNRNRFSLLIDAGANVDCKPEHLADFALMGEIYLKEVMGYEKPTVGLLSVGAEKSKGNEQVKSTFKLLERSSFNFIGNIEGSDIFSGKADIIICDGFVGNVVLKLSEGLATNLFSYIKKQLRTGLKNKIGAYLIKNIFYGLKEKIDYSEYGGAPLLGVKKCSVICHGKSNSNAIFNAVKVAHKFVESGVNGKIMDRIRN